MSIEIERFGKKHRESNGGSWRRVTPDTSRMEIMKGGYRNLKNEEIRSYQIYFKDLDIHTHIDEKDAPFMEEEITRACWTEIETKVLRLILKEMSKDPDSFYAFFKNRMEDALMADVRAGKEEIRNELKSLIFGDLGVS